MDNIAKQIENILLEQVDILNDKIKGINFLESLKYNLIYNIKPLLENINLDQPKDFMHNINIDKDNFLLKLKITSNDKPSSILKKVLSHDTLLISLKEIIKIDVFNIKNISEIESFMIFPLMGVCLSKKTNVNINFLKDCFYLEVIFEDKHNNVEKVLKDTI